MKEEGEMKGFSGAVVSLPLGVWPNLSLLVADSQSGRGDGGMGQPGQPVLPQETPGNRQWEPVG